MYTNVCCKGVPWITSGIQGGRNAILLFLLILWKMLVYTNVCCKGVPWISQIPVVYKDKTPMPFASHAVVYVTTPADYIVAM